jgi:hypothetical protein
MQPFLETTDSKGRQLRTCPICDDPHEILSVMPRALHDNHVILYYVKRMRDIRSSLKTPYEDAGIVGGRKKRGGFNCRDLRQIFDSRGSEC